MLAVERILTSFNRLVMVSAFRSTKRGYQKEFTLRPRITIRSYQPVSKGHEHNHHQVLIPLQGEIALTVAKRYFVAKYGDCVLIPAGCHHQFQARQDFRFLVIDSPELPRPLLDHIDAAIKLDAPALHYIAYIETQLGTQIAPTVEQNIVSLLFALLENQKPSNKLDNRIAKVLSALEQEIDQAHSIEHLARIACLSSTQFKWLFKQQLAMTPMQYLTKIRMQQAKVLLTNTDLPITLVAERVGYASSSAFTRRFLTYYGQAPKHYRHRQNQTIT